MDLNGHSPIVGDLVTNTAMVGMNSINISGRNGYWFEPWYVPPPPPPVYVWPTFTVSTAPDEPVHHMAFPLKAGAKSPCGSEIVNKSGTTGLRASADVDQVTCLVCLRALAKR
jgi:hypothetical protein